ncbi:MAG: TIGR04211 family SH3 domain-containing protein [Gammaproteobacteria bacterium]|nr:TIGR04211 family SH3 domain-containing protein [Gammaproteobacteria bacterium]
MRLIAILMALLPLTAAMAAETVYVTDELRLGLYDDELTAGRPFKTLLSGAELSVLERALRSVRVRTEDGVEGWVKTAYLVATKPARLRVAELERDNATMSGQLDSIRTAEAANIARVRVLEADLAKAQQNITRLPELESQNAELLFALDTIGTNVAMRWLILAAIVAFIAGCLAGYKWLDRRVRRQFGGLKVY